MKIKIENFGKIKSADITIGDFTIFVGDNNSGKTFLMQLIYGVLNAICNRLSANIRPALTQASCKEIEKIMNDWLAEKKDQIILDIFKKNIPIGSINIAFERDDLNFSVKKMTFGEYKALRGNSELSAFEQEEGKDIFSIGVNNKYNSFYFGFSSEVKIDEFMQNEMLRHAARILLEYPAHKRGIFLPASRSGLMLTRPFIFANKQNEDVAYVEVNSKRKKNNENEFGLTQPVYDFLQFLQTHKTSESKSNRRKEIINFINKNIIHGQLKKTENETYYQPEGSDEWLPPSITSSMVNEISPIMQILTSIRGISYVFYDEIETCQHPTTQLQMAKLLNRMVNYGYKMIVSTHSDTMAAAINLAISLSKLKDDEENLIKLNYEKADVLNPEKTIHAYQFLKEGSSTVVEEIPRYQNIGLSYDFSLFNKANRALYDAYSLLK